MKMRMKYIKSNTIKSLIEKIKALVCLIFALVAAWKFTIVFFGLIPFMVLSSMSIGLVIKKYTQNEFKEYEKAGSIAQEVLGSIRTVLSFGIHKKLLDSYTENLKSAEKMAIKKGLLTGLFSGTSSSLFNIVFSVGIFYGMINLAFLFFFKKRPFKI
jgi:ABC-type bacteriocin/lantibiotic exporter with double-glycine peptidase domain